MLNFYECVYPSHELILSILGKTLYQLMTRIHLLLTATNSPWPSPPVFTLPRDAEVAHSHQSRGIIRGEFSTPLFRPTCGSFLREADFTKYTSDSGLCSTWPCYDVCAYWFHQTKYWGTENDICALYFMFFRPVSAYALFFRDTQAAIKGQNPNASFGEVSKIVASMWDALDAEHKNVSTLFHHLQ